ncbi:MAG TPA: peptidoglycan DD-metalloendopeptidase family protein [Burkholderiaceae bacterium]|nr:peptidoglycan DD-metalloendopeptidase family protein [Burkholderiaceae bacterium]
MKPPAASRRWVRLLAGTAIAAFLGAGGAVLGQDKGRNAKGGTSGGGSTARPAAKSPSSSGASPQRQEELKREQRTLQSDIARLKRQLAASESSRSEASDALARADIAISKANRRLLELGQDRERLETQLAALIARQQDVASRKGLEQRQLDRALLEQHRLGLRDPMQLLLEGGDPNQPGRDRVYLGYLSRNAEVSLNALEVRRLQLASLQTQTEEKRAEIAKLADDEDKSRRLLEAEQIRRKRAVQQLAKEIAGQRQAIARLERDDQRLGALIDQISRILAEQARRDAERARQRAQEEASARHATSDSRSSSARSDQSRTAAASSYQPPTTGNFGQMKGKLALPVQGTVTAKFGSPRRAEGGAGPALKGVFLQAPAGTPVHAVGDGQVVFADWLRGFGNLLIIDHGDGYLSVYGNNEALLRNVGDRVAVGDIVASVGNSGGIEASALYFELRFQGRPFDPLGWVAAR